MVPRIGHEYQLPDGRIVHVQDRANMSMTAQVGVPDANDIIWEPFWVEWSQLSAVSKPTSSFPGSAFAGGILALGMLLSTTPAMAGFFDHPEMTTRFLQAEGYSAIEAGGSRAFTVCGKGIFNTEFTAKDKDGKQVSGYVCHELLGNFSVLDRK